MPREHPETEVSDLSAEGGQPAAEIEQLIGAQNEGLHDVPLRQGGGEDRQ